MHWIDRILGRRIDTPEPDPDGALVRVNNLQVQRGAFRLHIESLVVHPGSVVGLVGPNGAGKSTLIEALIGLLPLPPGVARVVGLDPARSGAQIRESVGLATTTGPHSHRKVGNLIAEVARYYPTWDAALTEQLVKRFSLDLGKRVSALSTGESARLRIVLALAFRPRVVVLDEPGLGLDLSQRRALFTTVLEVVQDPTRCVIISSHQLEDLERIADHLVVVSDGRCIHQGPIDDIIEDGHTLEESMLKWGAA